MQKQYMSVLQDWFSVRTVYGKMICQVYELLGPSLREIIKIKDYGFRLNQIIGIGKALITCYK